MTPTLLALMLTMFSTASAFSMSIPAPQYPPSSSYLDTSTTESSQGAAAETAQETSASWRIVLDIGREPLANGMPFNWARSGCRMPLVIPSTVSSDNKNTRCLQPISETVSFTGEEGAVIRPILGGKWELDGRNGGQKQRSISFSFTFPETLHRRDVTIEAGSTITCVGNVFTKTELDRLNKAFYEAREETWKIGGELNQMMARQGAPKKWNETTGRWEKRFSAENPLTWAQKQMTYLSAKAKQDEANRQRPDPNDLSAQGSLPGISDGVFCAKQGVVRAPNGAIMGKWSAEPINNLPTSYRR